MTDRVCYNKGKANASPRRRCGSGGRRRRTAQLPQNFYEKERVMRKILATILSVCMLLSLLTVQVFAEDTTLREIPLDVSGENTDIPDYKIADDAINIRVSDAAVYVLSGTTTRKIQMWGSTGSDPAKTFYLRLNEANLNGGITFYNNNGAKLVIELVDGTTNSVKRVYAVDLTVTGAGTLNAGDLGVTQSTDTARLPSALHIKDATINVSNNGNASQWNGTCVLEGNANVTYDNVGEQPVLALGQTDSFAHSLLMKDNAKLTCLHFNAAEASPYAVDGLQANGPITLQDSSYLKAQGRDGSGSWVGYGIVSNSDITVQDSATLDATSYGYGIGISGSLTVSGGKLLAKSERSLGVYAAGDVSIANAEAEVESGNIGIAASGNVSVSGSKIKVAAGSNALFSYGGKVELKNSVANLKGGEGYELAAKDGVSISGSWVESAGASTMADEGNSITDSVLFNGTQGKVIGNATLPADATVAEGARLEIPEGTSLTVPEGITFTNNGIVVTDSSAVCKLGTVVCNSHSGGEATCKAQAVCSLCGESYGEKDPENHDKLEKVPAKAATKDAEGNIEYWVCSGCGKYYADVEGAKEITKADTVLAKLPSTPKTGDSAGTALWLTLALLSGTAAAGVTVLRRKKTNI